MKVTVPLVAVLLLAAIGYGAGGVSSLQYVFGVVVPLLAIGVFLAGIVWRVVRWARSPVPFRIPTVAGQARSLPWIKNSNLESPHTTLGVIGRMALEVLCFRSLFRNTRTRIEGEGPRITYAGEKLLWLAAILFHYSFLVILLRHGRFFTEPVPGFILGVTTIDGIFQMGLPVLYLTNVFILVGLGYLLWRRLRNPQVRYVSLAADYFPLFLIITIAVTGILMRYFYKVDLLAIKQLAVGLVTFSPIVPEGVSPLFFTHLFLVSVLLAYIPFSKLTHMAGIFLSPTRNLANNNRMKRHVNPWNPAVGPHSFKEWQEEFHDKIVASGLPLDESVGAEGKKTASASG